MGGETWAAFGTGLNGSALVFAVYDSILIAGGGFTTAGGNVAYYVAQWDGSSWSPLQGLGPGGPVYALIVYNNSLFIGGEFRRTIDTTIEAKYALEWNGSKFERSFGFESAVNDFAIYDNKLIIAGDFDTV